MTNTNFFNDVISGLSERNKRLNSKYFYDAKGDTLFQEIMRLPEYYLTKCEFEILSKQSDEIIKTVLSDDQTYDVIELGVGDATKSICILESLKKKQKDWEYFPIDISADILKEVERTVKAKIPNLKVKGLAGEYFDMMDYLKPHSNRKKFILFLGSTIGNFDKLEALAFLAKLKVYLNHGDKILLGIDLVKDSEIILNAYNDSKGVTQAFNLNLLERINSELGGNFKIKNFGHYPMYHSNSGACESHLISLKSQEVKIGEKSFSFQENEPIFMEISQKYKIEDIAKMAKDSGYKVLKNFTDDKKWFLDTVWEVI